EEGDALARADLTVVDGAQPLGLLPRSQQRLVAGIERHARHVPAEDGVELPGGGPHALALDLDFRQPVAVEAHQGVEEIEEDRAVGHQPRTASSAGPSNPMISRVPASVSGRRSRRGSFTIMAISASSDTVFVSRPSALYWAVRVESRSRTPPGVRAASALISAAVSGCLKRSRRVNAIFLRESTALPFTHEVHVGFS